MAKETNNFRDALKNEEAVQGQKEIAKTLIIEKLFRIIYEFDVENGNKIGLDETVEMISERLGIQSNKEQIKEYVIQALTSGKYQCGIDSENKITAVLSKMDIMQKKYHDERNERAKNKLEEFVRKTELYAQDLSSKKIQISALNLREQFSKQEQEQNPRWITLAIDKVLANQEQARY